MREDRIKHVFIWPALLVVLIVTIYPLVYSLTISFTSFRLIPPTPPKFIGFGNYAKLLGQERFWDVIGTTSLISFSAIALQYVIGFALALAVHAKVFGHKQLRVGLLMPMLMAPVAVALMGRMVFNPTLGPINQFFSSLGYPNLPFLTDSTFALSVLIIIEVWMWTPFVMLLMLAGLQSLPSDVFEAAELENASAWQRFWTITFPMLLPISVAVVFIRLIESMKLMDTVIAMTGGGPGISTETLTLFAYQEGFRKFNLGYTAALSFLFLIVIVVICTLYLLVLRPSLARHR